MTVAAAGVLARSLASATLGGRRRFPETPLPPDEWDELVAVVRAERMEPVLAQAVNRCTLPVTDEQHVQTDQLHAQAMATAVELDRQLLAVTAEFERLGIAYRVLKGAAVAYLDYDNPAGRAYGDVDLLVRPADIEAARACLADAGGRRAHAEPRPGYDRRFGKGIAFRMPNGHEIDIHRTLTLGPFGLAIDLAELFDGTESFSIGGRGLVALDRTRRFVHACYHAVLGRSRPRLVPLLDMAHLAPTSVADVRAVVELFRQWRADAVLDAAIAELRMLGWTPPEALDAARTQLAPTRRQMHWLRAYRGASRSSARLSVLGVEAIPGWRDRVDYMAAVMWPANRPMSRRVDRLWAGAKLAARPARRPAD